MAEPVSVAALGSMATGNEPPRSLNYRGRDTTGDDRHAGTEYRSTDPPPEVVVRVLLTFDRAATDYLGDCERRGFTPTSLVTYNRTYTEFADFLPVDTDVSKVTTDDLRRYLNTKSRLAKGTRAGFEAHLAGLFKWLLREGKIAKDPMVGITRTRRLPAEDLDVVTVSTEDVRRMLAVAEGWPERLCMGVLVFTGCRRRAASRLRLSDYDQLHRRLRFREKGGKTIWKPVPDELDDLIRAAIAAGVYDVDAPGEGHKSSQPSASRAASGSAYLIPNLGPRPLGAPKERSHRVVYDIVKQVAARAGVQAHTHSLRAAFAVYYLETHQRDTLALQSLLGHRSGNTTQIYLRKLDRQHEMERVRDLSWGVSVGGNDTASESPQFAGNMLCEDAVVGAGGFEPPLSEDPLQQRPRTQPLTDALAERLEQAKSESADEARLAADETSGEPV